MRANVRLPSSMRFTGQLLVGAALGLYFTAPVMERLLGLEMQECLIACCVHLGWWFAERKCQQRADHPWQRRIHGMQESAGRDAREDCREPAESHAHAPIFLCLP